MAGSELKREIRIDPAIGAIEIKITARAADEDAVRAICSAKLKVDQDRGEIAAVAAGKRPIKSLFSKAQERLVEEHWPEGVDWDSLTAFGPVEVRKWQFTPRDFDHEVTVEEWVLPDESDLVEISIKAPPVDAAVASEEFLEQLRRRGLDTDGDQQTKTRSALRYFTTRVGMD